MKLPQSDAALLLSSCHSTVQSAKLDIHNHFAEDVCAFRRCCPPSLTHSPSLSLSFPLSLSIPALLSLSRACLTENHEQLVFCSSLHKKQCLGALASAKTTQKQCLRQGPTHKCAFDVTTRCRDHFDPPLCGSLLVHNLVHAALNSGPRPPPYRGGAALKPFDLYGESPPRSLARLLQPGGR